MLQTRLWMGSLLVALTVGMLAFDGQLAPWYPFQLVFHIGLTILVCRELIAMVGPARPMMPSMLLVGTLGLVLTSWVAGWFGHPERAWPAIFGWIVGCHAWGSVRAMAGFREPGQTLEIMARTWWAIGYLGLLPVFLAQLRWIYPDGDDRGTTALALAIFVPKGCDIGAFFAGRMFGRHKMAPMLSPGKTWEGLVGGLILATLVTFAIDRGAPHSVLHDCWACELGFGLTVGAAGTLGDLAESLLKRDTLNKDASQSVPGFGGVLDVLDAVIFAAPVVYLWCRGLASEVIR
jgi:phosphatidate cytidylyltransferase